MFKRLFLVGCVVAVALAAVFFSGERKAQDALVVGTGPIYPPYTTLSPSGEICGFDIDVARGIAKRLGKPLVIKRMEFDGLILALQQGKIDLILSGMSITPSRLKAIAMLPYQGEPMDHLELAFWKKIPQGIEKIEDLKGSLVAVEVGTVHHAFLNTIPGVKVKGLEGLPEVLMDIQYGKSTAALIEPHSAATAKRTLPDLQLLSVPLPPESQTLGMGIGVNSESSELIDKVQAALDEMRAAGELTNPGEHP